MHTSRTGSHSVRAAAAKLFVHAAAGKLSRCFEAEAALISRRERARAPRNNDDHNNNNSTSQSCVGRNLQIAALSGRRLL
jgi:hypothetical protein